MSKEPTYELTKAEQRHLVDCIDKTHNTLVSRHAAPDHVQFDALCAQPVPVKTHVLPHRVYCYGCGKSTRKTHAVYLFSCPRCGDIFQRMRQLSRPLHGSVALVTGGRTKLGHQVVLKLLRAGCRVVATTRQPERARAAFEQYPDAPEWLPNLCFACLDMDVPDLKSQFDALRKIVEAHGVVPPARTKLDILVNCAAQTIRSRDKAPHDDGVKCTQRVNRYGDAAVYDAAGQNSWRMKLCDVHQAEMEELFRVNAVAPMLLIQTMTPLLQASDAPYIINVHAREGLFDCRKGAIHPHTNMAKAALAMLTRTLVEDKSLVSHTTGRRASINGCDPGWISLDEYEANTCPYVVPPLDERDGAARILHPVWINALSHRRTVRHFYKLSY